MTLSGHTDSVVRCFFDENNLDVISISRNGQAFFWECNLEISDLISEGAKRKNNNPSKKQVRNTQHYLRNMSNILKI